jgi:hypothetical protein
MDIKTHLQVSRHASLMSLEKNAIKRRNSNEWLREDKTRQSSTLLYRLLHNRDRRVNQP